jgi:uncharacterized protein YfaA (DUF2138 family)
MNKKKIGKVAAIVVVLAGAALMAYRTFGWNHMGPVNSLKLDLSKPDALIRSQSLSKLPRDLLAIPLARDVLKEDFLFYYEQTEDRLGLKGSLRRIAYEHRLNWGDQLIRMVLDEPAEVALWRDGDGSLKHFAISVSRNSFTRLLEEAGKVALKDTQMSIAGELRVDGDKVPVYALAYAHNRSMLLAARGSRLVILSHPGMLYGDDRKHSDDTAESTISSLLTADKVKQGLFRRQFQLTDEAVSGHSFAVKTDFLSFGYQAFFGALDSLRFDFNGTAWQTSALFDGKSVKTGALDNGALWGVLPYNPGACFSLPLDWAKITPVLDKLGKKTKTKLAPISEQFSGPAAVCWYGSSRLYTPVFVATRKPNADVGAMFETLFGLAIGKSAATDSASLAVVVAKRDGAQIWQRKVITRYGKYGQGKALHMVPTLATHGQFVVFSPDDKLVEQVLTVVKKQAPAAADNLPDAAHTIGLIAPAAVSALIQKETFASLPQADEQVFRGAANAHLVPRLSALKKHPPYRLVMSGAPAASGLSWVPVKWQAVGP